MTGHLSSQQVRERVGHPIVDADGHVLEFLPVLLDLMATEGGPAVADVFQSPTPSRWYNLSPEQRRARREVRPGFWNWPAQNGTDFATATFPALLEERQGELGIDFSLVYPSLGLQVPHFGDQSFRVPACRAVNRYMAEVFAPHSRTMCPIGVIPMHSPEEALECIDAGVDLGLRAFVFPGNVRRSMSSEGDSNRQPGAFWIDTFGLDSAYDYDTVWRRCGELGIVVAFHSGSTAWTDRRSISNYAYNHIGHFASAGEATAKSLLLGGVTARFPFMRFAFLEGGVGWAMALLSSVLEHWEKRNGSALSQFDPECFDLKQFEKYFEQYAPESFLDRQDQLGQAYRGMHPGGTEDPAMIDDFALLHIEKREQFVDRFVRPYSFGCEADDAMTAFAFKEEFSPLHLSLSALFSSDIGHWDVPDASEVVEEAYEMVDEGLLTAGQFKAFTLDNVVDMYTALNPNFFRSTTVEDVAAEHQTVQANSFPLGGATAVS